MSEVTLLNFASVLLPPTSLNPLMGEITTLLQAQTRGPVLIFVSVSSFRLRGQGVAAARILPPGTLSVGFRNRSRVRTGKRNVPPRPPSENDHAGSSCNDYNQQTCSKALARAEAKLEYVSYW